MCFSLTISNFQNASYGFPAFLGLSLQFQLPVLRPLFLAEDRNAILTEFRTMATMSRG